MPSFFFNATATTEIYTLSLHDALPIFLGVLWQKRRRCGKLHTPKALRRFGELQLHVTNCGPIRALDRKSTRLNSSHVEISYAVFCLKKKKKKKQYKKNKDT